MVIYTFFEYNQIKDETDTFRDLSYQQIIQTTLGKNYFEDIWWFGTDQSLINNRSGKEDNFGRF